MNVKVNCHIRKKKKKKFDDFIKITCSIVAFTDVIALQLIRAKLPVIDT